MKQAQAVAAPADEAARAQPDPPDPMERMKKRQLDFLAGRQPLADLDKDGYPIVASHGWSTINGRARFYQHDGGVEGLLLMLGMMMDKPVADATGLKGTYEIEMHWVGEPVISGQMKAAMAQTRANAGASPAAEVTAPDPGPKGPTIQQALRDQLGLKLELKKGPMEMLVVDRVDRVPTEN